MPPKAAPKPNTDPEVDDVLRQTSPLHPTPKITANLSLTDGLDIGPITKRALANDYNRILRNHGSKKVITPADAGNCVTVANARKLVSDRV